MRRSVGEKVLAMYAAGEFDVATLFYCALQVGDRADPDGAAADPGQVRARRRAGADAPNYEYEPDEEAILADLLPRNISVQVFRALLENNASFFGAQMSAMDNATRNAGDMIKQADAGLQPPASGADHQRTHRNHFGRGSALAGTR